MGGGGSSGAVSYPNEVLSMQTVMMYGKAVGTQATPAANINAAPPDGSNIFDIIFGGNGRTTILGTSANPYFGVAAFSPDPDLQAAVTELNDLESILDTANLQNQIVEMDVTFKDRHKFNLAQSYSRVTATMASTGAAMGTAFPTALALMEVGFNADVKDMKLKAESAMLISKIQTVSLRMDYLRSKIAIVTDQNRQDVTYNSDEALWDLNVILRGMSGIGTIAGVSTIKRDGEPGQMQSVLGGMAAGASIGLMTPMPVVGAAVGAGIGGLLGALS